MGRHFGLLGRSSSSSRRRAPLGEVLQSCSSSSGALLLLLLGLCQGPLLLLHRRGAWPLQRWGAGTQRLPLRRALLLWRQSGRQARPATHPCSIPSWPTSAAGCIAIWPRPWPWATLAPCSQPRAAVLGPAVPLGLLRHGLLRGLVAQVQAIRCLLPLLLGGG